MLNIKPLFVSYKLEVISHVAKSQKPCRPGVKAGGIKTALILK